MRRARQSELSRAAPGVPLTAAVSRTRASTEPSSWRLIRWVVFQPPPVRMNSQRLTNAGVDIKELQAATGFGALIEVNRGCAAAFAAVYDCPVPVIAAVQGFCLGGGIGLVGNSDIIVASDDATFGLPEVDRGALGAATHLSRLVPQHRMRAMMYTSATVTAAELHAYGSVHTVTPRAELRAAALAVAGEIAAKNPTVMRAAKASLNGIDPWDVKRSYRYEQGFTFELNLSGVADRVRDEFGRS
ncbi:enoyl-CoA hydratase family protein [Micromonospora sp. NEAU-HG-1]|nr:enoyl-CoA hydratase family protein [Micromonospora rubida]